MVGSFGQSAPRPQALVRGEVCAQPAHQRPVARSDEAVSLEVLPQANEARVTLQRRGAPSDAEEQPDAGNKSDQHQPDQRQREEGREGAPRQARPVRRPARARVDGVQVRDQDLDAALQSAPQRERVQGIQCTTRDE